jgi:hypothetical protein
MAPRRRLLRQQVDGGWWYSGRLHWPLTHTRLLFVRPPDQVRLPSNDVQPTGAGRVH